MKVPCNIATVGGFLELGVLRFSSIQLPPPSLFGFVPETVEVAELAFATQHISTVDDTVKPSNTKLLVEHCRQKRTCVTAHLYCSSSAGNVTIPTECPCATTAYSNLNTNRAAKY